MPRPASTLTVAAPRGFSTIGQLAKGLKSMISARPTQEQDEEQEEQEQEEVISDADMDVGDDELAAEASEAAKPAAKKKRSRKEPKAAKKAEVEAEAEEPAAKRVKVAKHRDSDRYKAKLSEIEAEKKAQAKAERAKTAARNQERRRLQARKESSDRKLIHAVEKSAAAPPRTRIAVGTLRRYIRLHAPAGMRAKPQAIEGIRDLLRRFLVNTTKVAQVINGYKNSPTTLTGEALKVALLCSDMLGNAAPWVGPVLEAGWQADAKFAEGHPGASPGAFVNGAYVPPFMQVKVVPTKASAAAAAEAGEPEGPAAA